MSNNDNVVFLHGYVGRDPELKMTTSGKAFVRFSFATKETWTVKESKEKKSKTEWHQIVAWGSTAECIEKYVHKGQELNITGKIEYQEYPDPNDNTKKKYSTSIRLREFSFCGKKSDSNSNEHPDPEEPYSSDSDISLPDSIDDDAIPF
jgi:single-strand DNA-binding protein